MEREVGPKSIAYLFIAIGAAFMAVLLLGFTGFSGVYAYVGGFERLEPTPTTLVYAAGLGLCVTFIVWVALVFVGQTFCALILHHRSWMATTEAAIGTSVLSRRYAHWLPFATTGWSRFWIAVHSPGLRAVLAIHAIVLVPTLAAFVPLADNPAVLIAFTVVMLATAIVCGRWEASHRKRTGRTGSEASSQRRGADIRYQKGVEYRARKRARDLAKLKDAALGPTGTNGPAPTPFDLWVAKEIEEALRADPFGAMAARNGDLSALEAPAQLSFTALGGRVPIERLRELVRARATRKRAQRMPRTRS